MTTVFIINYSGLSH